MVTPRYLNSLHDWKWCSLTCKFSAVRVLPPIFIYLVFSVLTLSPIFFASFRSVSASDTRSSLFSAINTISSAKANRLMTLPIFTPLSIWLVIFSAFSKTILKSNGEIPSP
uniref:Uncharacterized protein n=1 Tax=Cacopsylla melanoneura TaxID=428564 RepID=A0A8D8XC25_9HEMI